MTLESAGDSVETEGSGEGTFNLNEGCMLDYEIFVRNLEDIDSAHFHNTSGVLESIDFQKDEETGEWTAKGSRNFSDEELNQLESGEVYVNIHSEKYPNGEVSGYLISESLEVNVEMQVGNYFFAPDAITVSPGQKVTIMFSDVEGGHTFVIDELGLEVSVTGGGSVTFFAPETTGEYAYYCNVGSHRSMGMEGILKVE
jgi:plastocyanin